MAHRTALEACGRGAVTLSNEVTRVMVVEDARSFQEVVVLTLSLEPYVKIVSTADSGEEALAALEEAAPGLVLLDFRLPGIDGLETAKRMKKQRPDIKIALVTAYAEEVASKAKKEGNVEVVIPKAQFSLARVQQLLGRES